MTAIHSVGPRSTGQTTESILRHFYVIAAIAIVFALLILRIIILRRRKQALSDFFRIGNNSHYSYGSYPPHDSNYGSIIHGIQLAPLPAAYRPDGRIRAADTDAHGRRLASAGRECEGKDALPAYDNLDRPPKYVESGWPHGGPPPPTEQSAAAAIPSTEGERSGTANRNTTNGVPGDNVDRPPDNTHAVAGVVHGSEAPLPPSDS